MIRGIHLSAGAAGGVGKIKKVCIDGMIGFQEWVRISQHLTGCTVPENILLRLKSGKRE
jgi:hypothetical protein